MAGIFGILGLQDNDRRYVNAVGQQLVFDAVNTYFEMHNAELQRVYSVFVQGRTSGYSQRYKLPGGGRLQRRGGQAQSMAVKANGGWDVAFPLEDFGAQYGGDDVALAYMTLPELDMHLQTIRNQDIATRRDEILRALFVNTARTFLDNTNYTQTPELTIQPLANGDTVVYPPVLGSNDEAQENHYIESNYAATDIDDDNDPYGLARNELEEHFGAPTGFGNVVSFIHPDEVPETQLMSEFIPVPDNMIRMGADADIPSMLPTVPGRIIGRVNGAWVSEWRWIPSGYTLNIDLDAPPPLMERIDPPETGLQPGLRLVSENQSFPMQMSHYRNRFGIGVANRLNGVVIELANGGGYTVPVVFQ